MDILGYVRVSHRYPERILNNGDLHDQLQQKAGSWKWAGLIMPFKSILLPLLGGTVPLILGT